MAKKKSNKSLSTLNAKLKAQNVELEKLRSSRYSSGGGLTKEESDYLFGDDETRKRIDEARAEKAILDINSTTYDQKRTLDILSTSLVQPEEELIAESKVDDSAKLLNDRINKLEKETKDSIALAMSMIAVNKELLRRLQEDSGKGTASKDTSERVSKDDNSTDIINKIYNFFIKDSERSRKQYELDKDFAEERAMESKKRKSAGKRQTASRVKKDPSGPSSNPLLDLLGFVAGGIGGLFKFITGGLFGLLSKGLGGIKDFFKRIPGIGLLGSILGFFARKGISFLSTLWDLSEFILKTSWKTFKAAWWMIKGLVEGSLKIGEKLGELLWDSVLKKKFEKTAEETAAKATEKAVVKGAEKVAGKEAEKLSAKELAKRGLKYNSLGKLYDAKTGKFVSKEVIEQVTKKQVTKKLGSTAIKKIPVLGAAAALYFASERVLAGDTAGGGLEVASGAASVIPGFGTAASLGIDIALIARDVYNEVYGTEQNPYPFDSDLASDPEMVNTRKDEIITSVKELITDDSNKTQPATETNTASPINAVQPEEKTPTASPVPVVPPKSSTYIENATGSTVPETTGDKTNNNTSTLSYGESASPVTSPVAPEMTPQVTIPTTTPTAVPAPTEQPENDSASLTPETTRPSMVTASAPPPVSLPDLSEEEYENEGVNVINTPPNVSSTTSTEEEMPVIPSVRNTNPVLYRTVAQNDRALIRF